MRFSAILCSALIAFAFLPPMLAAEKNESKSTAFDPSGRQLKLQHVVSFKFKETATKEQVKAVEESFRALKTKIPQIEKLQWGLNNSPEGLNKGFTHCWILTFASEADRDAYLIHPDHKEFGKGLKPVLADVFVVDFWAKE